jgi:uncharacterized membrane protein YgaE (UPF0421/DUF939 family)
VHRCREAIAAARAQLTTDAAAFIAPGPRMVDEIECVLSVLLAIIFAHLIGAQNISWAALSGYLVMRGHVYDSLRRGILRIVGTSTGAALAIVTFPLVACGPIPLSAAMLLIGWCSLYAALTHRHAYAFLSIGLTFVMIALGYPQSPGALLALASTRILEVFAGTSACVLISMVSTLTVRRQWPAQRQPNLFVAGWHGDIARHAAQGGLALCLLPLLNAIWPLPELSQAAIAIMALMLVPVNRLGSGVLTPVSRRIGLRILGCACGAAFAGLTLLVAHGSAIALIVGSLLGVMIGRHIENGASSISYGGTQLVLTVLVALVPDSYIPPNVHAGALRLAGTLIGIAVLEPILAAFHFLYRKRRTSQRRLLLKETALLRMAGAARAGRNRSLCSRVWRPIEDLLVPPASSCPNCETTSEARFSCGHPSGTFAEELFRRLGGLAAANGGRNAAPEFCRSATPGFLC